MKLEGKDRMQTLAGIIGELIGKDSGFILMVVPFTDSLGEVGEVVSNIKTTDVIEILKDFSNAHEVIHELNDNEIKGTVN